jgi:hypothetical protein
MATPEQANKPLLFVLVAQWAVAAFILIAPFGFDLRSSWGLDIEHLIQALLLLLVLTIFAGTMAWRRRHTLGFVLAVAGLVAGLVKGLFS